VKAIWNYIKENNLQNPNDKKDFLPDDKLKLIFKFPVNMFSMHRQLSRHIKASNSTLKREPGEAPAKKKPKKAAEPGEKKLSGFAAPLKLSPELAAVVGKEEASRGECQKLLWAYIREHNLQNPEKTSVILVHKDEKLYSVLGVRECTGFGMAKYLKAHFLGPAQK
jgi:upstream activation factor subunit UAF30